MGNYNLTQMATQLFFPGNVAQLDDAGLPSIMVYIPAFKNSDVLTGGDDSTHPAFIVNGKEIAGFYYSKYQNVVHNGKAYSLPAEDPQADVNYDTAINYCEAKGPGWHLSTAAEWAAIALWCKKNGFLPYGNNNNGKDSRETEYKAVPSLYNTSGTIARVATGTGPITWSHDKTPSGIWDLNGNIGEWQGGLRFVWGELQILANNNAANPDNPQNDTSTCWKAINAADGSLVDPESKTSDTAGQPAGRTVKIDFVNGAWVFSTNVSSISAELRGCQYGKITATNELSSAAILQLRALALLPDEGNEATAYENDYVWLYNGTKTCYLFRGGSWYDTASAGVFSVYSYNNRSYKQTSTGFRAAYIPEIIE